MIFLKKFNENENFTIYDEEVKKAFPNELEIYTSEGSYRNVLSSFRQLY